MKNVILLVAALLLTGCMPAYTLVKPAATPVAQGAMKVSPSIAWNKAPRTALDIAREETWTQNGQMLDNIRFFGGLKDGEAIAKQRPKDDRKVPVFRSDMTPQDLTSMIESYYRIRLGATVFETVSVKPATFLGQSAVEFDFNYVGADEVKRRGRSLLSVIDGKLYSMSLDGAALHYFDAAVPEFQTMAGSAVRM